MLEIIEIPNPNPAELWEILERHGLLSAVLKINPWIVANMCKHGQFCIWHEDGRPLALQLEHLSPDPEVLEILIVPEDRGLGKRKAEISDLQPIMRNRWFPHFRRVQSSVPASRVNIHRIVKSLGFTEETRRDIGLRDGIKLGHTPEGVVLYGLLPADPLKVARVPEEAGHGLE